MKPTEPTAHPSAAALYFARRYLQTGQSEFKCGDTLNEKIIMFVMEERCEVVEMKGLWLRVSAQGDVITVEDISPGSIPHRSTADPAAPVGPLRAMARLPKL
jgi:hypothetical protein